MRRLFWILPLLLSACTKVTYQEIAPPPGGSPAEVPLEEAWRSFEAYSPQIDVMVAFLWPENIGSTADHAERTDPAELAEILVASRKLKVRKEAFLQKKHQLRISYDQLNCTAILEEGTEADGVIEECSRLEDMRLEHDRSLKDIYQSSTVVREIVAKIAGHWIATNQDFPQLPQSQFDLKGLHLSAFGSHDGVAISYAPIAPSITQRNGFQVFAFEFPSQNFAPSTFRMEVTPTHSDHSVLFQGDLFLLNSSHKKIRQGFVYWEQLKK